jgi:recombination protein RecA
VADSKTAKKAKADKDSTKDSSAKEGKSKALNLAMETIEKQFGKGSIMKLGEAYSTNVETIPTGSLSFDLALGGIPKGRIIEISGLNPLVKLP